MRNLTAHLLLCGLVTVGAALPGKARAEPSCPPPPDHSQALTRLIGEIRDAPDERSGQEVSDRMWALWADAPDAYAQELLNEGMTRRGVHDFAGALKAFDALVAYCPDYAEGYNQRAFINFIREDYAAALPDLERALELSPRHVGALSGQALTFVALERLPEAALALRRALALNPWLSERHLLPVLEAGEDEL